MIQGPDKIKTLVDEAISFAVEHQFTTSSPLMISGSGNFYNQTGKPVMPADVLREHYRLREAVDRIRAKLEAALSMMVEVSDETQP